MQIIGLSSELEWESGCSNPHLTCAVLVELKLCTSHAYDLLASIWMVLHKKGALLKEKEKHA